MSKQKISEFEVPALQVAPIEQEVVQPLNPAQVLPQSNHPESKPRLNLKYMRDKDREMVKGIFRFHEVPNGEMSFTFLKYKGDQLQNYTMRDNEVCTVPLGVAKHLNHNLWYPVHGYSQDENGKSIMRVTQKVRRCSFQSLEFMDMEDLTPVGSPA